MFNNTFLSNKYHFLVYFISAIIFSYFLDMSALDDGLRHLSFAKDNDIMKSWGEVFPFSLFGDYDPWFGWHFILDKFLIFFSKYTAQIVINTISLFLMMILLHQFISKYINYKLDSLTYILVLIIVLLTSYRYVMIRPDMLSGFYIMFMILIRNKFLTAFIFTIIYGPFYYLFFLYTGTIGLVYLVQKKWHSFLGVIVASLLVFLFFFTHNFDGYIETVYHVLIDQKLRMGLEVSEGRPIFDFLTNFNYFILLPVFLTISILLVYKKYSYFRNNTLATFLLVSSILWVNQSRYYHLFLPIIFVYTLSIVFNARKKIVFYNLRKYQILLKRFFSFSKNKKLFYFVAIPYSILMLGYIYSNQTSIERFEKGRYFEQERFNNKVLLSNKMDLDMYSALYYNPSLKVIPSCSIGWFDHENKDLKKIYVDMMKPEGIKEKELKVLLNSTKADFYLHYFNRSQKILDMNKLKTLGIIPKEIQKDKILFEVNK